MLPARRGESSPQLAEGRFWRTRHAALWPRHGSDEETRDQPALCGLAGLSAE